MKIFIGFLNIGNFFINLKRGLEKKNCKVSLFLEEDKFSYSKKNNIFSKCLIKLNQIKKINQLKILFYFILFFEILVKLILFIYSLFKYDVYLFSGFNSFFYFWELKILKFFKKKIIIIFFGSDARHPFLSNTGNNFNYDFAIKDKLIHLERIKKKINRIEKYADIIINHTATSHLFKKKFVPLLYIGFPIGRLMDIDTDDYISKYSKNYYKKNILLLHFPSSKNNKGTEIIINTINDLRKEFLEKKIKINIKLKVITNATNKKIINNIKKSDIVVNELYSDLFASYADIEATLLNKVSLKFGYYLKKIKKDNSYLEFPKEMIYFYPEDLKKILKKYILNYRLRNDFVYLKNFLIKNWSDENVAKRFIQLINNFNNKSLNNIYIYPKNINYLYGAGANKQNILNTFRIFLKNNKISNLFFHKKFKTELKNKLYFQ